ncbi:MAG: carboxyl transferase domain-containing protein [Usitatibacter sp.]
MSAAPESREGFKRELDEEFDRRKAKALAMGGPEKLAKRARPGLIDARARVDRLFDAGTFAESGLFTTSIHSPEDAERSPSDGKITGYGRIGGRWAAVVSNDFTVFGASSSATNMRKIAHMKRVATQRGLPIVFFGESSGARMPDTMGGRGMGLGLGNDPTQYQRMRETPWAAAVLGMCYGSSFLYTCCSDFRVMRKGGVMAVSSPRLIELATNEKIEGEVLGGWQVHSEVTGLIDMVVETDEEAVDAIKKFLSYLPSNHNEAPPIHSVEPGSGEAMARILDLVPPNRSQVYDMRKVVAAIADKGSVFEMKPRYGKVLVTALARLDGKSVGFIANNPLFKGGVLDSDAADKAISFMVMCDSFNIPLVLLVDTPGFVIGAEAEKRKATGKIVNFMNALQLVTVPRLSIIIRKTFGQAYLNMGGGRNSDEVAAWPTAEVSFMTPRFAVTVVHGTRPGEPGFEEQLAEMEKDNNAYEIARTYAVQNVIKPEDTRDYLIRMLDIHSLKLTGGVGQHLMRAWPTSY